jgi:hypothetical protein
MKKSSFIFTMLLLVAAISVNAQSDQKGTAAYSKGSNVAGAGIGLGSSIAGYTYGSQTPAISLQYERGIAEVGPGVISIGGYLGFKSYKYSNDGFSEKWRYTIIGVRGAYHLTSLHVTNLDLYGGLMLSYNNLHFSDNDGNSGANYGSAAGFSAFVGGRYYFSKSIAAFAELGYGVAYINLGVALKF